MFALLKLELEKLFRAKSFYLSFIVLIGFVVLMLWGFYTYAERKTGGQAVEQFKYTYESKQYFNGLDLRALLSPVFFYLAATDLRVDECRLADSRRVARRHPANDLHASNLACLTRAAKFLVTALHAGSPAHFLHRPESDGGIDLRRLG